MRILDDNGLVPTAPAANPSFTVRDIDTVPTVAAVHTLRTSTNVVTNMTLGRARIDNTPAVTVSVAAKLNLSGGLS